MKKLIIAIISLSMCASCSILKAGRAESVKIEKKTEEKTKPAVSELKKPAVGDTIVARWGGSSWAEGKVESIDRAEAKIVWTEDLSKSDVELKDVFVMPAAGAEVVVKPGDYTVVKGNGNWWQEAEIKEVASGVVKAKFIYSSEVVNLSPDKVLTISPAVSEDIKDAAKKQDFLNKAQERRPVLADYEPKAGDRVVAAWTSTSWYAGKVKSVSGDKALIAWEAGMRADEVTLDKIAPFPTADTAQTPAVNDFVLLKPSIGAWVYGQVTSVEGAAIEAKSVDATRSYKPGEYIVIK